MLNHTNSSFVGAIPAYFVKLLFSLAVFLPVQVAHAIPVEDLYVADVLVLDESSRQLRTGARAGLLQVLVRVSGTIDVEQSSLVRNSLRNPAAYYYQYSYESTDRVLVVNKEEVPAKLLRLHFEPSAIARLLREANLPVWGSNRPAVLLWIAISDGSQGRNERRILGEADTSELVKGLTDQANERGLPIMFPILDLEDASRISAAEVWGAFLDRIETASSRYTPDAILSARVRQEANGRWSGKWSYQVAGNWQSIETVSFSAADLVRNMINLLADNLAEKYALSSSRASVRLVVEGVRGLTEYAELSAYLDNLTPVLRSSIVALQGDVAEFELQTEGQYQQLVEIIELDERLILLNRDQRNERLHYRWKE